MTLSPPLYITSRGIPRDVATLMGMLTQRFGENPQIYAQFGLKGHNGLDWGCHEGTPIYASHDGTVSNQIDSSTGMGVVITCDTHKTIYWHLSKFAVDNGASVKAGEIIGFSGNTGFSTGPHLHWGLKMLYNGEVLNRDNGYDGAIDPTSFLVWRAPQAPRLMTKEEVRNLYRLAFYREPEQEESEYWTGKELAVFLETAIADRAAFLKQP